MSSDQSLDMFQHVNTNNILVTSEFTAADSKLWLHYLTEKFTDLTKPRLLCLALASLCQGHWQLTTTDCNIAKQLQLLYLAWFLIVSAEVTESYN